MRRQLLNGARAVAVTAIALTGCYESDFPLDPAPRLEVDEAWLGTWRCLPFNADADEEPATLVAKRGADRRYDIGWHEGEKPPDRYQAFASAFGEARLLNVEEMKPDGPTAKWVFVRPTLLRPDVLQLQIVNDGALKGVEKSPAAVRGAIERQLSSATLFVDFCVCVRAKESGEAGPQGAVSLWRLPSPPRRREGWGGRVTE
jgi:hypothetical protein